MRPSAEHPVVVSILTVKQAQLLTDCLTSLFEDEPRVPYLVYVFDQASTDGTQDVLASFVARYPGRITVYRHHENLGFVLANNMVFERFPHSDVVILNDDTVLLSGWLDALVERAYSAPDIGIVGARLVYPNGTLQEAGGEIFRDGSGQNIGKWDDPTRAEYLAPKDVQYCSGALLYIRREVLDRCGGGFDPRFAPAYYEDTDLCFAAREAGFRVVYEPASVIVHREGATSGVDLKQGAKRWQEVNRETFVRKWAHVLRHHRRGRWEHPDPPRGRHVLVIHQMPPLFDQASGDRRLYEMLLALNASNRVTFLAVDDRGLERYTEQLRRAGIHAVSNDVARWGCYGRAGEWTPGCAALEDLLAQNDFDLVLLEFYHQGRIYLDSLRRLAPGLPVVVDSVDVHFLRERREAALRADPSLAWRAERTFRDELAVYERADAVITVTQRDAEALLQESPTLDVRVVPNLHEVVEDVAPREGRAGLVFVGGFRHPPNVDAALWLVREILPLVRREVPDVTLTLAGSDPPPEVRELAGAGVDVTGFVPDLAPLLDGHLVSVAPLRYGAGMKGKIAEAMGRGLPVVTTSCGAEGMDLEHGVQALLGDDAASLAAAVVELLRDGTLWDSVALAGRAHVAARWSVPVVARQLEDLVAHPPAALPRESRRHRLLQAPSTPPTASGDIVGVMVLGTDPESTGRALGRISSALGRPVDAVVGVREEVPDGWDDAAARDGYRLGLVRPGESLGALLERLAPAIAGDDLLLLEDRTIVFRHGLGRLFDALDDDPSLVAVRPCSIPVAPLAARSSYEPWDAGAARARSAEPRANPDSSVVLLRRSRLTGPLSLALREAAPLARSRVIDPALPPVAPATVPAPCVPLTVAWLAPRGEVPQAPPEIEGAEIEVLRADDGPLGARLADLAGRRRGRALVVVDGRIKFGAKDGEDLVRRLQEVETSTVVLRVGCENVDHRNAWYATLASRLLAADAPRALPLLAALRPAVGFLDPSPRLFDVALDGYEALSEAVLRGGAWAIPKGLALGERPECGPLRVDDVLSYIAAHDAALARQNDRLDRLDAEARFAGVYRFAEAGPEAEALLVEALAMLACSLEQDTAWAEGTIVSELVTTLAQVRAARAVLPILAAAVPPARQQRLLSSAGLDPRSWPRCAGADARAMLSLVCAHKGDVGAAREHARRAVDDGPRQRVALFAYAQSELRAGRTAEAERALAAARNLAACSPPELVFAWPAVWRGILLEAMLAARRSPEALVELVARCESLRIRPPGALGSRLLELEAAALVRLGRPRDAARRALDARALHPGVADRPTTTLELTPA